MEQTALLTKQNRQTAAEKEQMNIVVIGHVDHGKSTVIGRLMADTGSLPEGKLEEVKERCRRNARPFEYAFLLDALKDEQDQGITIDSARCFFKSDKREYIIIDAPGHIEFLKNMISGAARAEAAVLIIDAHEGVQENSRRHGYLLSMLGINQVVVCINKMDLVDYRRERFELVRDEYLEFLRHINIEPKAFIPVSAREGDNIISLSEHTAWYDKSSLLESIDGFTKEPSQIDKPFRFPVQDVYKFTAMGDDRRMVVGRVVTGTIDVGDEVIFLPSGKSTHIKSIEGFNTAEQKSARAGQSTAYTLDTQIYIKPGEIMCRKEDESMLVNTTFKVNIFWLGRRPMIKNKRYKLKLATARVPVWLREINTVMDASNLTTDTNRQQIERHDVAECILETLKPLAVDLASLITHTGRFVIIDDYEISGGGIVLEDVKLDTSRTEEHVKQREQHWQRSALTPGIRSGRYNQKATLVILTGPVGAGKISLAKQLEEELFNAGRLVYYLGLSNSLLGVDLDIHDPAFKDEYLRRLGEISHLFTDAGVILITTVSDLDDYELKMIETLNQPGDYLVVNVGENRFNHVEPDLILKHDFDVNEAVSEICGLLSSRNYLMEYYL